MINDAEPDDAPSVEIPNLTLIRGIGKGANGTVYEARDALLGRSVAVKLWNSRGRDRARHETTKIAALNHPLIVTTHLFGELDGHPYAVMELVPGASGKDWIATSPDVRTRIDIWRLYFSALRHLHSSGVVHGDPHLGNIIVFDDEAEAYTLRDWRRSTPLAMKLADAGTSEFWSEKEDFAAREAKLIRETASRMFRPERFDDLSDGIRGLGYRDTLNLCDAVVSCISLLHGLADYDRRSQIADAIVGIVMNAPFFNLDELAQQVFDSPATSRDRVVRRLNGALLKMSETWRGPEELDERTRSLYASKRQEWLAGDRKAVWQR
jgi:tRNA A-37 threonylcarbamoyl transferase component Bud32